MSLPTYPSLSKNPDVESWKEEPVADPTIRSSYDSGVSGTRARFTTVPIKIHYVYRDLSNTDKETLETFEQDTVNYGAGSFTWTHFIKSTSHAATFSRPIKYTLEKSLQNLWKVEVEVEI